MNLIDFKIYLLSFKIKLKKIINKSYNPYPKTPKNIYLNPSDFINSYTLKVREPPQDDYKEWQAKSKKHLKKLLNISEKQKKITIISRETSLIQNIYNKERIYLKYDKKRDIPIDLISKKKLINPRAIILCLQGANSGAHLNYNKIILPIDYKKIALGSGLAIQAAENNFLAISYERIGYGERIEKKINTKNNTHATFNYDPAFNLITQGSTLIGETINELNSIIDFLKKEFPKVPIFSVGYSDGGTVSMVLSSVNEDIKGIAISGCLGFFSDTINTRTSTGIMNIPSFLKYYDSDIFISLTAPKYCLIISGQKDHIWPYRNSKKVYDKSKKIYDYFDKDNLIKLVKVNGGHKYYPNEMWPRLVKYINSIT